MKNQLFDGVHPIHVFEFITGFINNVDTPSMYEAQ